MAAMTRMGSGGVPRLRLAILLAAGLAALLLAPGIARAGDCDHNLPKIGYLGITDLECDCTTNISVSSKDGRPEIKRIWTFRGEPKIGEIRQSGPSAGKLKPGDVITAVDGALITTREGSARFSSIEPGQVVKFTVRRDGDDIQVAIRVGEICPEVLTGSLSLGELVAPRAPEPPTPATPRTPAPAPTPPTHATPGVPPVPPTPSMFRWQHRAAPRADFDSPVFTPEALPKGWLGMGLSCQECGGEKKDSAKTPVWYFGTIPTISMVEGPSARAGLRRGDQLTHIDGVPLVSEEGGRRFGAVQPGQRIRWRLIRDGKPTTIAVTAAQRHDEESQALGNLGDQLKALGDAKLLRLDSREMQGLMKELRDLENVTPPPQAQTQTQRRLRYSGSVGGSDVEVRGLGNVVVDESGDEVVITTRDAVIRIRPGEKTRVERRKVRDHK